MYQAHIDVSLLPPGEFNFNKLNDSYMIMIMPFDLFGKGRYRYTFQNRCEEDADIALGDGAAKIYLNTEGQNADKVSTELIKFLKLVKNSDMYLEDTPENERLRRIQKRIKQVKLKEEIGVSYMTAWEEKMYERLEGREEGREEGRREAMAEARIEQERLNEKAIHHMILDAIEYTVPMEKIITKLKERYQLSEEKALAYIERYRE